MPKQLQTPISETFENKKPCPDQQRKQTKSTTQSEPSNQSKKKKKKPS